MEIEIIVNGAGEVAAVLEGIEDALMPLAARGLEQGLQDMAENARYRAPYDTGELRDSIKAQPVTQEGSSVSGKVAATAEHAIYQEVGTGEPGRASGGNGSGQNATYRTGGWVYPTKDGEFRYTLGQPAQPFMYPAYQAHKDAVVEAIAAAIKEGLE